MTTLILVRHAEAQHHVQDLTGGWTDSNLTGRGQQQAQLLAVRLGRELAGTPVHLLCSDLQRAVQTAAILGAELGAPCRSEPALRDINNGIAAGMTRTQAKTIAAPLSDPILDWIPYPAGESWRQFSRRVLDFIEAFAPARQQPAILVTHAVTVNAIVQWWLGLDVERRVHFSAEPASLTVLRTTRWGEASLERLNDTAHLAADGLAMPLHI